MLKGHDGRVSPTEFTSSGQCLVSSSYDRTIRIWNAETEALQQTLMVGPRLWHSHLIIRISHFHHRTAQSDCVMWQQELWKRLGAHNSSINTIAFSPDGHWLASASDDGSIRLWNVRKYSLQESPIGHGRQVNSVSFSPNGQWLVPTSDDKTIGVWDATTGALQKMLQGHSPRVTAVAFSPNGHWLASNSDDTIIQLWAAKT